MPLTRYHFNKIGVFRPNALGDFIFVLPALQALKETYPEAELVYLGQDWHKKFLVQGRCVVDRVRVIHRVMGSKEENADFLQHMREEKFDVMIQVYGGGKWSNPMVSAMGARITVGLCDLGVLPLDISVPYLYYHNEYMRNLMVVKRIGAMAMTIEPKVLLVDHDDEVPLALEKDVAVIHPGASDLRRRWPPERFATVGDWLVKQGFMVVVTGTQAEKELVDKVIQSMREARVNACGKLTLAHLTGLLAHARVLISNDTGPYHLAYALGTPVVGIFWGPNLINSSPLDKSLARTLSSWQMECRLCGFDMVEAEKPLSTRNNTCDHAVSFVDKVGVEEVIGEIKQLFSFMYQ
jgi:ADP-heptose:LPS heptosyltransferase